MTLRTLFSIASWIWIGVMPVLYALMGVSELFGIETLILTLGLNVTLLMAIRFTSERVFPVLLLSAVTMHLYYFPRLLGYLAFPDMLTTPFDDFASKANIDLALRFILVGLIATVLGLIIGERIYDRLGPLKGSREALARDKFLLPSHIKLLIGTFVLWVFADFFFERWLGLSLFNPTFEGKFRTFWVGLKVFFGLDTCFFVVFGILFYQWHKTGRGVLTLLGLSFVYLMVLTIGGSKGAVLRIDSMVLILAALAIGREKIPLRTLTAFGLASVLLGYTTFYAGVSLRIPTLFDKEQEERQDQTNSASNPKIDNVFDNVYGHDLLPSASKQTARELPKPVLTMIPIINRLGEIDYPIYLLSVNPTPELKSHYLSLQYLLKSLGNILSPGTPFIESELPTNRLIPVLFRDISPETVLNSFNSEPWSIWALAKAYFGTFGGWLFLFFAAMIFQFAYLWLLSLVEPEQPVLPAFVLWSMGYVYFKCFGFDHLISLAIFSSLQLAVILIWLKACQAFWYRMNHRTTAAITEPAA